MPRKMLIDQALAIVAAAESLGPEDQVSLTDDEALVWAIYLRVRDQNRGVAPGGIEPSVRAAMAGGIPGEEIEAAIAAAGSPATSEEM